MLTIMKILLTLGMLKDSVRKVVINIFAYIHLNKGNLWTKSPVYEKTQTICRFPLFFGRCANKYLLESVDTLIYKNLGGNISQSVLEWNIL